VQLLSFCTDPSEPLLIDGVDKMNRNQRGSHYPVGGHTRSLSFFIRKIGVYSINLITG